MDIKEFKKEFDPKLIEYVKEKNRGYKKLSKDKDMKDFFSHLEAYVKDGKRIRPYCAYIGYQESGKRLSKNFWDVAIALELVHVMALIHDDIIDNADSRRGLSSVHNFIKENNKVRSGKHHHYSISQALLIGDLVLVSAFESLLNLKINELTKRKIHQLIDEVILGQMIDVDLAHKGIVSKKIIMAKSKYKSALYTMARPLEIGAVVGGITGSRLGQLVEMGEYLGLAYQTQDDALDIFGSEKILKKKLFNDIREGQQTLLTDHFFKNAKPKDKKEFLKYFGKNFSLSIGKKLSNIMRETGTEVYIKKEMTKFFNKTKKSVELSSLNNKTKNLILELTNKIESRF